MSEWATQEGKCIICGKPVDYEGDAYCRRCGMRSELDDMRSKGPSSLVAEPRGVSSVQPQTIT